MKKSQDIPVNEQTETLASRLRLAREEKYLTRKSVKHETGISDTTIDKYERGDQDPTVPRLEKLAELYEVTLDWLLKGEEAKEAVT